MTSELVSWAAAARRPELITRPASVVFLPARDIDEPRGAYVRIVKPATDRVLAVVILIAASIPMLVIAAVVAVSIGRPVLFRQRRVGRNGEEFDVVKFRTMRPDRRGQRLDVIHDRRETHKSERDPRHTAVGRVLRKYSLDELPQLFNVLHGEMSIVGPRPELVSVVETYPSGLHQRHYVRPGLTGLWQVSARGNGPMHENGQWDLVYVEQVSLRTDMRILARTPRAVLGSNTGS